jgi:hypothetical protein
MKNPVIASKAKQSHRMQIADVGLWICRGAACCALFRATALIGQGKPCPYVGDKPMHMVRYDPTCIE